MQDKSKLGTRYRCFDCGVKFYDLNRPEPICPACGTNQLDDPAPDPRVAVMAAYKGNRMTKEQVTPIREAVSLDDATEDGGDSETLDGEGLSSDKPDMTEDGSDDLTEDADAKKPKKG